MLTILHVGENGEEMLVECDTFRKERRGDGFFQFLAFRAGCEPGDYLATWCCDLTPGRDLNGVENCLYVMNSKGSTVARYSYRQPDHENPPAMREAEVQ